MSCHGSGELKTNSQKKNKIKNEGHVHIKKMLKRPGLVFPLILSLSSFYNAKYFLPIYKLNNFIVSNCCLTPTQRFLAISW